MRGSLAMTAIAVAARRGDLRLGDGLLGQILHSRPALPVLCLAAAGELVIDKLPMTPSRLEPGPLFGRIVGGGVTGAIIGRGWGGSPVTGGVAGAVSALASSWVFGKGRAWVGSVTSLPDPIVAIGEDILAIGVAAFAAGIIPLSGGAETGDRARRAPDDPTLVRP
jgi:uncharacterized membrane protein